MTCHRPLGCAPNSCCQGDCLRPFLFKHQFEPGARRSCLALPSVSASCRSRGTPSWHGPKRRGGRGGYCGHTEGQVTESTLVSKGLRRGLGGASADGDSGSSARRRCPNRSPNARRGVTHVGGRGTVPDSRFRKIGSPWRVQRTISTGATSVNQIAGKRLLENLKAVNAEANPHLERLALKLATGAGKTTVMAMLIA
jgi:hypothetical protein